MIESVPVLFLADSALKQLQAMLSADKEIARLSLRVHAESEATSGLKYALFFDNKHSDDEEIRIGEISVILDPASVKHLQGSTMEFIDDLSGGGFRITLAGANKSVATVACPKSIEA
jgi:iron-sulfur cluster assembly protein